ncbi:hypothetical protein ACTWQF_27875 [Streptomyces sp. 8N114]|uniref:hypothetical protein n=1 Tax=Streptomyces sp. 8N114 TaxID=3457419 RepID=UPI003FD27253
MVLPSPPDAVAWEKSLGTLRLWLGAVGPREHTDWLRDAAAVLQLRTRDPRGWRNIDLHTGSAQRTRHTPYYPLDQVDEHHLNHHLELVTPHEAAALLTYHCAEYGHLARIPSGDGRPGLLGELRTAARTVLGRFGPSAEFATNEELLDDLGDLGNEFPDGERCRRSFAVSCFAHPDAQRDGYLMDVGVLAASETEVGVFWNYFID